MIANYHTHTWRCNHAAPDERAYVENAIEGGLKILGFSDHTPQIYDDPTYVSRAKMLPEQLPDYVDTVLKLREEYKEDIEILLGLEVEYYPKYWDSLLDYTAQFPFDYFILGQHNLGNEIGEPYCGMPTEKESDVTRYVNQTIEAMNTGMFTYFAHPDLINFRGDWDFYEKEMRRICVEAKKLSIPLEINLLGVETNRNYPNPRFWKMAAETGNDVILGSDAHKASDVVNKEGIAGGMKIVEELGLHLLETVNPVRPVRE